MNDECVYLIKKKTPTGIFHAWYDLSNTAGQRVIAQI